MGAGVYATAQDPFGIALHPYSAQRVDAAHRYETPTYGDDGYSDGSIGTATGMGGEDAEPSDAEPGKPRKHVLGRIPLKRVAVYQAVKPGETLPLLPAGRGAKKQKGPHGSDASAIEEYDELGQAVRKLQAPLGIKGCPMQDMPRSEFQCPRDVALKCGLPCLQKEVYKKKREQLACVNCGAMNDIYLQTCRNCNQPLRPSTGPFLLGPASAPALGEGRQEK